MFVPVVDQNNHPLMPTISSRARRWVKSGKATPFWKKGVYCVRLNVEPNNNKKQDVCIGLDPGLKREAYTVKSKSHTYLNILSETVDWVKNAVEQRRNMRRSRRFRNTRYRPARFNNRKGSFLSPSVKSRWNFKKRICIWIMQLFPISSFCIEDIRAITKKGSKNWNSSFSLLEIGKNLFYTEIRKLGPDLFLKQGYETKQMREKLRLKKTYSKLVDKFESHNVDSWVLANYVVGGHVSPDNKNMLKIVPLRFHRRQLHVFRYSSGGIRKRYGGTRSMGFKRGSLVKHKKYGFCYVGGTMNDKITIHSLINGERLSRNIKSNECQFKTYLNFRSYIQE